MINFARLLVAVLLVAFSAITSQAAPLKVAVSEFKVTGAANKDELKSSLQALLSSRLAGDNLRVVEAGETPDLTVSGSYTAIGKVFSLDARVTDSSGKLVGNGFEQGESADDIIPAVTRLAQKLAAEVAKAAKTAAPLPAVIQAPATRPVTITGGQPEGDIVRREAAATKAIASGMIGERLTGVMISLAQGKRISKDERELVVALAGEIRLYSQGKDLKLVQSLKDFNANEKIVAVDTADLDNDGTLELYVTNFHGEELSSRVYLLEGGTLRKIAAELPYFFRAMALKGGEKKVYAQQMGRDDDYYGGLYEVVKKGNSFTINREIKLPRHANIFNTNQVLDKNGKALFVILHPDNYIQVYDDKGELLWKSSDKYGGSETYFSRDDSQNIRVTGSKFRKSFLEQRITVTSSGEIIIPKNEGFFVIGDSRSFTKNAIYAFSWNGAALDELWHTRLSQNYLSDYLYDEEQKELLLLEVVKKAGFTDPGASAISVKKVE